MTDKIDGHPVEDGWLMRYSRRRGEWVRRMPVSEWEARKLSIACIRAAKSKEERDRLHAREQKSAIDRRRKWAKEL